MPYASRRGPPSARGTFNPDGTYTNPYGKMFSAEDVNNTGQDASQYRDWDSESPEPGGLQDQAKADQYARAVAGLQPKIQGYEDTVGGEPANAVRAAGALDAFDPYAGLDKQIEALRQKMQPDFDQQLQGIKESFAGSGTFRGGQTVFAANRAQAGFESAVAREMALQGTARAGLALQAKQSAFGAHETLSGDYTGAIGMESDLNSGMSDYYQKKVNARNQSADAKRSALLGFFGNLAKAGATAAAA